MTKLIKDKFNTLINTISSKKDASQRIEISEKERIIPSKDFRNDEYGYFNRMENL